MKAKRIWIMIVVSVLIAVIPSVTLATDYSQATDEELWNNYNALISEMISRGLISDDNILFPSEIDVGKEITRTSNRTLQTYIVNTRSHVIHIPTCSSVAKMSEKNKQVYTGEIAVLLKKGYDRCGICNP